MGESKADHDEAKTGDGGQEDETSMLQARVVREEQRHPQGPDSRSCLQTPQSCWPNTEHIAGKHRQQRLHTPKQDGEQV